MPADRFTSRAARSPAFTWGFVLVTVVETGLVHVLLGGSRPLVAWAITVLGGLTILSLLGQDRALATRAITIEPDRLVLRVGLRLSAIVPWAVVREAETVSWSALPAKATGYFDAARPVEPNLVIRFRASVEVTGAFGVRRRVSSLGLCVDDPEGLCAAVTGAARVL